MQYKRLCQRKARFPWLWMLLGGGVGCSDPGWVSMASMLSARESHAAVVLRDGDILLLGGQEKGRDLASAERFSQRETLWIGAAPMHQARGYLTAVFMEDEGENTKVIAVGGGGDDGSVSAEVYDPKMDAWMPVKAMGTARAHPSVVLLDDGQVLVAGGAGEVGVLAGAESYDPNVDAWNPAEPMKDARKGHTATRLGGGKILVVGGENEGGVLSSSEVYDQNAWLPTASLQTARHGHSATKLSNGAVLVVGGENNGPLAGAELYDPALQAWKTVGAMSQARHHHTATLLINGKVLVVGGHGKDGALDSAELYDPGAESWSTVEPLPETRSGHTAALLATGGVMVAGGGHQGESLKSVELLELEGAADIPCKITSDCPNALVCNRDRGACELLPAGLSSTSCALQVPASNSGTPWLGSAFLFVLASIRRHGRAQSRNRGGGGV